MDNVSKSLCTHFTYISSGSCLVCDNQYFSIKSDASEDDDKNNFLLAYHRGLPKTLVHAGDFNNSEIYYYNDIIITPDGKLCPDWNLEEDEEFNLYVDSQW